MCRGHRQFQKRGPDDGRGCCQLDAKPHMTVNICQFQSNGFNDLSSGDDHAYAYEDARNAHYPPGSAILCAGVACFANRSQPVSRTRLTK